MLRGNRIPEVKIQEPSGQPEIAFVKLPIPREKPYVMEVLINEPQTAFRILVNGALREMDGSSWFYVAAEDGSQPKEFTNVGELKRYLLFMQSHGYPLDQIKVVREFDFNMGGEFDVR